MGHESVGHVAALGPETSAPVVGTVVTFNPVVLPKGSRSAFAGREQHCPDKYVLGVRSDVSAAFADFVVVPTENVVALTPDMPVSYGALVEPLAVAVHAVARVGAKPGDDVLVLGGGPIGQSLVLALKMAGAEQAGIAFGRAASLALDAVGLEATRRDALLATEQGASIGLVGMGSRRLTLDAYRVSTEERTVVGSFTYSDDDFRTAADWMSRGSDDSGQLISREIPPEQANAAFRGLADGDGAPGKVLIRSTQTTLKKGY